MAATQGTPALVAALVLSLVCLANSLKPATPCLNQTCHYRLAVVRAFTMQIQRGPRQHTEVYIDEKGDLRTYFFYVEANTSQSTGNDKLTPDETDSLITADGVFREIIAVQDLNDPTAVPTMPGPTIDVPKGSNVIVDVSPPVNDLCSFTVCAAKSLQLKYSFAQLFWLMIDVTVIFSAKCLPALWCVRFNFQHQCCTVLPGNLERKSCSMCTPQNL